MPDTPSSSSHGGTPFVPPLRLAPAMTMSEAEASPPPPEVDDDLVGTTLSNTYTVVRVVGEGGMGRVYEAQHTRIKSKRFAIKTLHPEFTRNPEVIQRFHREVEAAASIQSPYVVGVYDVDKTPDGRPFFVAEYLEGSDLGAWLDKVGRLPVAASVYIVRQVCKALAAAHARGVVHRDIKPDNIFLTGDPHAPIVKVVDFGISRIDASERQTNLTKTGIIMGTPSFMSPEQARGARSDQRTDVYCLGAVLFACLTGTEPFDKGDASSTVVAVLTEEPPRPRDIEPSIPEHLEAIVQRAMSKEPAERYQSMLEFDDALAPYDTPDTALVGVPTSTAPGPNLARITRAGSMSDLAGEAREIKLARPLLALLLAGGSLFALGGLVTAIGGAIRLTREGGELTGTETALVLVAVLCLALTPGILGVRHVRKTMWSNSVKVLEFMRAVRGPLLVAAFAYGTAALFVRLCEVVFLHGAAHLSWPAWDVVFFLVAVGGAAGTRFALRLERIDQKAGRQVGASTRLSWIGLALLLLMVIGLLAMRGDGASTGEVGAAGSAAARPGTSGAPPGSGAAPLGSHPAESGSAVAPGSGTPGDGGLGSQGATAAELEKARAAGAGALAELVTRYPTDPTVLKALVVVQAGNQASAGAAVDNAGKLLDLSPAAANDPEVVQALRNAADGPQDVSDKAVDLLSKRMGTKGLDVLYDLATGASKARAKADALLKVPEVRARFSPALAVAVELREAVTCQDKKALLGKVSAVGDQRAVNLLQPLTQGTSKGCGFLSLSSCPARCAAEAQEMRIAIQAVRARSP